MWDENIRSLCYHKRYVVKPLFRTSLCPKELFEKKNVLLCPSAGLLRVYSHLISGAVQTVFAD